MGCICRLCEHCEHVWIAALCSEKLFPNLEAALKGVFNRVLKNLRKASARFHRTISLGGPCVLVKMLAMWNSIHPRSLMLVLMSKNIDDAKGALGVTLQAIAKSGLAIEL